MLKQEQITREVRSIGNGAHVFIPREWLGSEVIISRVPEKSTKERIFSVLEDHLESVVGAYLYGSRTRGEEEKDSDIDLLLITNKKVKIKAKGFEIISIVEEDFEKFLKLEPLMIYSILAEAKALINSKLLDGLREKYMPKIKDFKEFLEDTNRIIEINGDLLDNESENQTQTYTNSKEIPYSLILRLRGIFIIQQLLGKGRYSHKEFKFWISKGVPNINLRDIYDSYKSLKNNTKLKSRIKIGELGLLLDFLKKETIKLISKNYGKKKKKT